MMIISIISIVIIHIMIIISMIIIIFARGSEDAAPPAGRRLGEPG